jgi:hypothetical protein
MPRCSALHPFATALRCFCLFSGEFYGKINKLEGFQHVQVFELNKQIYRDSSYYHNLKTSDYSDLNQPIASKLYYPAEVLNNNFSATNPNGLTIKLPNNLGQRFLDNPDKLANNGLFIEYFKGLMIKTVPTGLLPGMGGVNYFNLLVATNRATIRMYFKNDSETGKRFDFVVTSDCARINFIETDYSSVPAIQQQLNDSLLGREINYVQSGALNTRIFFPFAQQWKDSMPVAINRAELIIKVRTSDIGAFIPNNPLVLYTQDSQGNIAEIPDFQIGSGYFRGTYNSTNGEYRFNIAVYLQQIIDGRRNDDGIWLQSPLQTSLANRVILSGSNNMSVKLTYTKL